MRLKNVKVWLIILMGGLIFSGCYTQLRLEDSDGYPYKKEVRKKVIIKDQKDDDQAYRDETEAESEVIEDTTYYEEEETYYYPRHRRSYKYYHPGITIIIDGAVFYDPWYFDYFYYPWLYCRVYYSPWYWVYRPCYGLVYWATFYDPYYNPFFASPYWYNPYWYDPYWPWYYYPPTIQYRKNDYTRLRDNDGGRGIVRTGNWGRDLNLQVYDRTKMRDSENSLIGTRGTENRGRVSDKPMGNERRPTYSTDRERIKISKEPVNPRINDREQPTRKPDNKNRDRKNDRPNVPQRKTGSDVKAPNNLPDRKETPTRNYRYPTDQNKEIIIERKLDLPRTNTEKVQKQDKSKIERYKLPQIDYEIPRRDYKQPIERNEVIKKNSSANDNNNGSIYRRPNNEVKRYEAPHRDYPSYQPPQRIQPPNYNPPQRVAPPSVQTPSGDRRRN